MSQAPQSLRNNLVLAGAMFVLVVMCTFSWVAASHLTISRLNIPPMYTQVDGRCAQYLTGYVALGHMSRMPADKYRHMREMIAVCEAGKDPSKVAYHEITRADRDVALYKAIRAQMAGHNFHP